MENDEVHMNIDGYHGDEYKVGRDGFIFLSSSKNKSSNSLSSVFISSYVFLIKS